MGPNASEAARPDRTALVPVTERTAWLLVGLVWAAYFGLRALEVAEPIEWVAKGLLMPVLLLWVLAAIGASAPRALVLGLLFATVGDIAILFVFELGILGFLIMQICYIVGFLGLGAPSGLRARWPIAATYAGIWLAVNIGLGPSFGDLQVPVAVYSLALCVMAALAAGVSSRVGIGAALFLFSDALIAVGEADLDFTGRGLLIMPTYLAGQYLIATGWVRRIDPRVAVPV
jgi:uncharacterized membrane protein YhhN